MEKNKLKIEAKFFIQFLKERGIFSTYKKEVGLQIRRNKYGKLNTFYDGNIVKLLNSEPITWYVDSSLVWKDTKQGESFWRKMEDEFEKYYENNFTNWSKKHGKSSAEKA